MAKKKEKPTKARSHSDQKLYRNDGVTQLVLEGEEINPGDEFYADLDPLFEQQMLQGGHLSMLQDRSKKADEAAAEAAVEGGVAEPAATKRRS